MRPRSLTSRRWVLHAEGFSISVASLPECEVVAVRGELDGATAPELVSTLEQAHAGGQPIVIDLSGLEFIDSGGVHAVMEPASRLGRMALVVPVGNVAKVLSIVRIEQLMPVYERLDDAVASLR